MPWTTEFEPFPGKQTLGQATATFTDEQGTFVFTASVNLDRSETVAEFVKLANAALAEYRAGDTPQVAARLAELDAALNAPK
jgi:hypothetical protein